MAQSGPREIDAVCPLSGVKPTGLLMTLCLLLTHSGHEWPAFAATHGLTCYR